MNVYLASFSNLGKEYGDGYIQELFYSRVLRVNYRLLSYHAINMINHPESKESFEYYQNGRDISLFLDSGAYSAFTQKLEIDIDKYIGFIKEHEKYLSVYAVLDVIGDVEGTYQNQQYMEMRGLTPIPCFHAKEDYDYLEEYVNNYDYIALGGMAQLKGSKTQLKLWLDDIWSKYLVNEDGTAKIKIHGFGITSVELMKRYPWYSVDSTSWVLTSRFGSVYCDIGGLRKITVSDKGEASDHFKTFKEWEQDNIREYFKNLGGGYKIEELATSYKKRDEVNILYFMNIERQLSENPPRFINRQESLF